jgi:imidazole glycerol-phosphate synthase subunit HisF
MLRSRVTPCLLIHDKGLVKTIKFKDPKYVGDPINAVKIFNEKEVDEIIVLDIDCTVSNIEPDYKMIKNLGVECRMPLCYGGGISSVEQAVKIISLGVEKIALSSAAISNPRLVRDIANAIGSQSVVVILDVKKGNLVSNHCLYTHNGKVRVNKNILELVSEFEENGVGEIVINSIDKDGTMSGYDIKFAKKIRKISSVPLTILGGAGSMQDIKNLIDEFRVIGASAGSIFVFMGRYRAVLISYAKPDML